LIKIKLNSKDDALSTRTQIKDVLRTIDWRLGKSLEWIASYKRSIEAERNITYNKNQIEYQKSNRLSLFRAKKRLTNTLRLFEEWIDKDRFDEYPKDIGLDEVYETRWDCATCSV